MDVVVAGMDTINYCSVAFIKILRTHALLRYSPTSDETISGLEHTERVILFNRRNALAELAHQSACASDNRPCVGPQVTKGSKRSAAL